MDYALVAIAAMGAAALTFFSGFGLGTLLLPVFALVAPIPVAVAATAVVHLVNNLFKLTLTGRHADRPVIIRFGLPALLGAFAGAWALGLAADRPALAEWGDGRRVTALGLVMGAVMVFFAFFDLVPRLREWRVPQRWMPLGGLLSGFFGGLSGHQGALRSAFLTKAGLSRDAFIGTGVVIACLVDLARLGVYGLNKSGPGAPAWRDLLPIVAVGCAAAIAGSLLGNALVKKTTIAGVRSVVGLGLIALGAALAAGLIG